MLSEFYVAVAGLVNSLVLSMPEGLVPPEHRQRIFFTILLSASHTIPVVIHEAFLLFIGHFRLFEDCIIQPARKIDTALSEKCWKQSVLNHFFFMPLALCVLAYPLFAAYVDVSSLELPTVRTSLTHLFVCIIAEDFLFYWSHRFLHHPMLYKHFHKQHHEFKVLTGYAIASEYTHPVESLLGNVIPVMAGPYLTECHFSTTCLWLIIRMFKTCDAHSGYSFKWSPFGLFYPLNPTERHDFHHETGMGSYGSFLLLWDQWSGTDAPYLQSVAEKRRTRGGVKTISPEKYNKAK